MAAFQVSIYAKIAFNYLWETLKPVLNCFDQENYLGQKDSIAKGFLAEPLGSGAYCPISIEDVGIAAAEVLLNPHPHFNKPYTLTGPKALTGTQLAHRLGKVVGHPVNFVNADPQQVYGFLTQFMAEYQAKVNSQI